MADYGTNAARVDGEELSRSFLMEPDEDIFADLDAVEEDDWLYQLD